MTLFRGGEPLLALAPMQDVTNGAFWSLIHGYGGADIYWTEYFRVSVGTPEENDRLVAALAEIFGGENL